MMHIFSKSVALPVAIVLAAVLWVPVAGAQTPAKSPVPAGMEPPPGMCRIWLEGVPASRQPQPTDCPTAIRRKPANGQVIFSDEVRHTPRPTPADSASTSHAPSERPPAARDTTGREQVPTGCFNKTKGKSCGPPKIRVPKVPGKGGLF